MNKNIEKVVESIKAKFEVINAEYPKDNQAALDFSSRDIHAVLAFLKGTGFRQLSMLSCIDWIDDKEFQLVFLLFDWDAGIRLQVRTRIDRDNPKFTTITDIYPGAKYYERDVHEFFGVEFEGNPDSYKQLFLENWDDMPPLRKDFDSQAYSDKKYPVREYKKVFNTKAGDSK